MCHVFTRKMCTHCALMFPIVIVGPFAKWGIDFTTCHPTLAVEHKYIIGSQLIHQLGWSYAHLFRWWEDNNHIFLFNHIIARFRYPKQIVTNHGSHFKNSMMLELSTCLGFKQEHSTPYYLQGNWHVEVLGKINYSIFNWQIRGFINLELLSRKSPIV